VVAEVESVFPMTEMSKKCLKAGILMQNINYCG